METETRDVEESIFAPMWVKVPVALAVGLLAAMGIQSLVGWLMRAL